MENSYSYGAEPSTNVYENMHYNPTNQSVGVIPTVATEMPDQATPIQSVNQTGKENQETPTWKKILLGMFILIFIVLLSLLMFLMIKITLMQKEGDILKGNVAEIETQYASLQNSMNNSVHLFQTSIDNGMHSLQSLMENNMYSLQTKVDDNKQWMLNTAEETALSNNETFSRIDSLFNETSFRILAMEKDIAGLQVRLVGGGASYGRVEILHAGVWGTICDDLWDPADATVICRMLGYAGSSSAYTGVAGSGQIWLDDVACTGNETHIGNCGNNGWGVHNCVHYEDASVRCN